MTEAEKVVRCKLADGRTICTPDVLGLLREIERLNGAVTEQRHAIAKAAIPLEVIRLSGWSELFTDELRQTVDEAIEAVRAAVLIK